MEGEGIIGGEEAKPDDLLYQISLRMFGLHICGGGIINEKFILTAAHCVIDEDNNFETLPLTVVAGIQDFNQTGYEVEVAKAYVPSNYNGSLKSSVGDIAVVQVMYKVHIR